jgi:hypothetical protein
MLQSKLLPPEVQHSPYERQASLDAKLRQLECPTSCVP